MKKLTRPFRFVAMFLFAARHQHYSRRCIGELPCDPRAHIGLVGCLHFAKVMTEEM